MLDVTKKVWDMLMEGKTNEEILEISSISSLKKNPKELLIDTK